MMMLFYSYLFCCMHGTGCCLPPFGSPLPSSTQAELPACTQASNKTHTPSDARSDAEEARQVLRQLHANLYGLTRNSLGTFRRASYVATSFNDAIAALPSFVTTLRDCEDIQPIQRFVLLLRRVGSRASPCLKPLLKNLREAKAKERDEALILWIYAIGGLGGKADSAVPTLVELLSERRAPVRRAAALALGEIGPSGRPAVDTLTRLLEDSDLEVRVQAALALWRIEGKPAESVSALLEVVKNGDAKSEEARRQAIEALGEIGKNARRALDPLGSQLDREEDLIRFVAAEALLKISPEHVKAAKILLNRLKKETPGGPEFRLRAASSLLEAGKHRNEVGNIIDALANDEFASVRIDTLETLGELDLETDVKLKLLSKGLADKNPFVRQVAAEGLGKLGAKAKPAEEVLQRALLDDDLFVRLQAGRALKSITAK